MTILPNACGILAKINISLVIDIDYYLNFNMGNRIILIGAKPL